MKILKGVDHHYTTASDVLTKEVVNFVKNQLKNN